MTQQETNQAEWNNPLNWSGPRLLGFYSSKADTRLWVPKRISGWGWTINLGRPGGMLMLSALLLGVVGILAIATILAVVGVGVGIASLKHLF